DEAERLALDARAHAVPEDTGFQIYALTALAMIRGAQARDEEAEQLFRDAIGLARGSDLKLIELHPLEHLVAFLRERGREADAAVYEGRIAELVPAELASTERIA